MTIIKFILKQPFFCKQFILLFFLLSYAFTKNYSQSLSVNFKPNSSSEIDSITIEQICQRYEWLYNFLKKDQSGSHQDSYLEIYNSKVLNLKQLNKKHRLLFSDSLTYHCNNIIQKVIATNPLLKDKRILFYIQKSVIPNAYSMGEGVIAISLDLLTKIDFESELSYIICHELGHDYFKHVLSNMQHIVNIQNDKTIKKKIKKISKQDYDQNSDFDKLATEITIEYTKYTRKEEFSADSLGLILFTNAGYNPSHATSTILKLDSLDNFIFQSELKLETHFSFKEFEFKQIWIYEDTSDLNWNGNIDYTIPDSLKTHPDCKYRANSLENIINNLEIREKKPIENFSLKNYAIFEMIDFFSQQELFDFSIYYSLNMLKVYPNNNYLHCTIVNALYEISEALKNHQFSEVVHYTNSEYPKQFNTLLRFLNQLSFSEINTIMNLYFNLNVKHNINNDSFANYLNILLNLRNTGIIIDKNIVESYQLKFPQSNYSNKLNEKILLTKQ